MIIFTLQSNKIKLNFANIFGKKFKKSSYTPTRLSVGALPNVFYVLKCDSKEQDKVFTGSNFNLILTIFLSSSSDVKVGKNLIRIWVEFGKKMVSGKQGVMIGHF